MSGIPAGAGSLLGKRLGKYEILALLALGGTAEIYLARIGGAAGFEKYVVVKCLHDHLADDGEFVKMFLDEARLAAHLDHSNIVQTMELGEHEHRYYMVMEFLAGLSLAMMVRRASERLPSGRIPIPLALNVVAQACAGLHYAHERTVNGKPLNIVHRDISPQNLVVSFEGVVKLVDFGIAKAELRETRTQSGTIKGKFAYMSPEQCVANNVDRRTDVFALGVILHELLTGRRLFKKPSPYDTYQAVIECAVEPPSKINREVDPALDPLVMRAVAKDKEKRFATAEELGDALLGYMHQRGISSGPSDVSRFFEASFGADIDEHGARMRELISGRVADPRAGWDGEEDEGKQTLDIVSGEGERSAKRSGAAHEPSAGGSLSAVIGQLDGPSGDGDDDDDAPSEHEQTRIETNPLDLGDLDAEAAKPRPPARTPPAPQPAMPPSGPLRLPGVPSGPLGAAPPARPGATPAPVPMPMPMPGRPGATPAPQPVRPGMTPAPQPVRPGMTPAPQPVRVGPSGKFPEAASLPTMIAQPDDDDDDDGLEPPELARTEIAAPVIAAPVAAPPAPMAAPNARTVIDMAAPNLDQLRASMGLPPQQAQPPPPQQQPPPEAQQPPPEAQQPPQQAQQPPPYGAPASGPNPMPMAPQRPNLPPVGPSGYPVMNAQLRDQMASGATVFPSDFGSGGHDASAHAGPGDWGGAGAGPVRAMPPWLLAVLFVGALGGALLITILIARAMR